jgi:hypothetical protein
LKSVAVFVVKGQGATVKSSKLQGGAVMDEKDEYLEILSLDTSTESQEEVREERISPIGMSEKDRIFYRIEAPGRHGGRIAGVIKSKLIGLEQFGNNAREFASKVLKGFSQMTPESKAYELQEIELSVGIDANGEFKLLGIGASLSADASIKLVFRKKKG